MAPRRAGQAGGAGADAATEAAGTRTRARVRLGDGDDRWVPPVGGSERRKARLSWAAAGPLAGQSGWAEGVKMHCAERRGCSGGPWMANAKLGWAEKLRVLHDCGPKLQGPKTDF